MCGPRLLPFVAGVFLVLALAAPRVAVAQTESDQGGQAAPPSEKQAQPPDKKPPPPAGEKTAPAPQPAPSEGGLTEEELKELEGTTEEGAKVGPEVFDEGVKLFYENDFVGAAKRMWDYMSGNAPGAKNYGYAEYFIAQAFDKLGLTHAAMEYYYNVAKNRTKPELLPDALGAMEIISREYPFDQPLILKDLIYDTDFGYIRKDLRDFTEYYQGLLDYRNGFIRWGEKHFSKIKKQTYYYYKSRYVQAVYDLVKYDLDGAIKSFSEILDSDIKQVDVVNSTRQSVARILFEQKKFGQAYEKYEEIDAPIEKQASVFLEESWTQYYLKDYRRAMGLLYALEAPAFFRYFNPEKYLIKALIYKNLCHYNVGKDAVAEFRQYYGDALKAIYDRVDLDKNEILLDAALQDPALDQMSKFARLLDTEMGRLADYSAAWSENGLLSHLNRIYDLKIQGTNRLLKVKMDKAIRAVAEKLLAFQEQMNLLDYEIGLSIYKRIKGSPTQKEARRQEIPSSGDHVYYRFDGEFWNDELHDFRFFIEDRCFSEERWE
ncbi:MAG TPA: hypothetical protein VM425_20990 [Myxococcota bacterium]|nr:hypothetical protein [Myxococcota bacterium]